MGKDISRSPVGWVVVMACAGTILSRALESPEAIPAQKTIASIRGGCTDRDQGWLFARTELFFEKAKPDGSMVTD